MSRGEMGLFIIMTGETKQSVHSTEAKDATLEGSRLNLHRTAQAYAWLSQWLPQQQADCLCTSTYMVHNIATNLRIRSNKLYKLNRFADY